MQFILLLSVFVIATCGLIYELISSTLASYLLGDSVTQFSTVIGVYLFSMGIGSYLSRHINRNLTAVFIQVELLVGLVGGFSSALLFLTFEQVASFRILLYALVSITGTLVGLEIPLLMRILKHHFEFKDLVSKVFTFDYVGALLASLLFPLLLVPHLGLIRSSFLFGTLNVLVALWTLHLFRQELGREGGGMRHLRSAAIALLIFLVLGFVYSDRLMSFAEASTFPDPVIYAKSSHYQRLVLTQAHRDLRLFLNGNLQFSSRDEYRYHEALVHPGLAAVPDARRVLVLGGGDGLAVREILKYPAVQSVTLVDLDPMMTALFTRHEGLVGLNGGSLKSSRVRVINADAFLWMRENHEVFDFIVVDFPDPSNFSIGKLYSLSFFRLLRRALAPGGITAIQSTSPLVARRSYWCIVSTLRAAGLLATPYHAYVPSFGEWGFVLGSAHEYVRPREFPAGLRFIDAGRPRQLEGFFEFPPDMAEVPAEVNRLNNQVLVRYFDEEWSEYLH